MTLANEYRPTTWSAFMGGGLNVEYLKAGVGSGKHPSAVWITGPPGVGKSTLAYLYARSALCLNRVEGSYDGCGVCPMCKAEDNTNISYHVVKDSTSTKEALEKLVDIAYSQPVVRSVDEHYRSDQHRRFIIIDEAELIHYTTFSMLLNPLEHSPRSTTWILISMEPDKLNAVTREAIESRCKEIALRPFSPQTIANVIMQHKDVDEESALLIGKFSKRNMRRAWQWVEFFEDSNSLHRVSEHFLGKADYESRMDMWECLRSSDTTNVVNAFNAWSDTPDEVLFDLLLEDVIGDGRNIPTDLLKSMELWRRSPHAYPLYVALLQNPGVDVARSSKPLAIDVVPESSTKLIKVADMVTPNYGAQVMAEIMSKVKGEPSKIEDSTCTTKQSIFSVSTLRELVELYAISN